MGLGLEIRAMGTTSRLLSCVQTPTVVVSGGWCRARLGNWTRRVLNPVPTQIATNWTAATIQSLPENLKTTTTTPTTTWQAKGCKKKKPFSGTFGFLKATNCCGRFWSVAPVTHHLVPLMCPVMCHQTPSKKQKIKNPKEAHAAAAWPSFG